MKLDFEAIKSITCGAVRITEEKDGVHFFRFTQEQEDFYRGYKASFYQNTFSTSGIKLRFRTDSARLTLGATPSATCARSYFSFDLTVNGRLSGSLNNFDRLCLPSRYAKVVLPHMPEKKTFDLGQGEKEVCLYLPWNCKVALWELSLDDGAKVIPVKREKKLLCFGDSITQGYDALHPLCKYTTRLADEIGYEEYNKAIGGEIFVPGLAETREDFRPDLILASYGSNDWNRRKRATFEAACHGFYRNLSQSYPDTKIIAITPIWRKIWERPKPIGTFDVVEKTIFQVAEELPNVFPIRGFDFVPKDPQYFGDGTLHPNNTGFQFYFEGLKNFVLEHL